MAFVEHDTSSRARGLMYHSRMRFLKSRENSFRRRKNGTTNPKKEVSSSSTNFLSLEPNPCPQETLIPPKELMTRAQAFRFAHWKHDPENERIQKMETLIKKEDPDFVKKREEILSKVRAAEASIERKKRGKGVLNIADMFMCSNVGKTEGITERDSMAEKTAGTVSGEQELENNDNILGAEDNGKLEHRKDLGKENNRNDTFSSNQSDSDEDDDSYPDCFSFLSEWKQKGKKKKKVRWTQQSAISG